MEPWDIRDSSERPEDNRTTFIIFCEDGSVEPVYFETFERSDVKVSAFGNKKQHHQQVDYATEYFRKNDLLEVIDGREKLKIDEGAQVWCVFDRDKEPNDGKDTAFNDSIVMAEEKGINIAWSNDDFELWVLLHFEDVDPTDPDFAHRQKYYERLTSIIKHLATEHSFTQHLNFNYYESMKSKKRFIPITYQLMKDNESVAINRAKALEQHFQNRNLAPHAKAPCTMIHYLIEELRNAHQEIDL